MLIDNQATANLLVPSHARNRFSLLQPKMAQLIFPIGLDYMTVVSNNLLSVELFLVPSSVVFA